MLKKLIAGGIFCAVMMTQVLMGVADAAPAMAPKESVVQEVEVPKAAAGTMMQATRRTYVYKSSSTKSAKRLLLKTGKKVKVVKDYTKWTKVKVSGKTGYVKRACLKTAATYKAGASMQLKKATFVFKSKSTKSAKRLLLRSGNKVKVVKDYGTWTKVKVGSKTGYVKHAYLKTVPASKAYKAGTVLQPKKTTYVYKSKSTKSTKRLKLRTSSKVKVVKDYGTWAKVKAGSKTGYVVDRNFKTVPASKAYKAGTVLQPKKTTYVYKSKSTKSTKRLKLGTSSKVKVVKDYGTWAKVKAGSKTGYVVDKNFKTASTKVPYSSTSKASISTSQVSKNIIRIRLVGTNGKKLKVMINKGSSTSYYNLLNKTSYQSFPLNMGKGTYSIGVLENISGTSYKYIERKSVSVSGNSNGAYLISTSEIYFTSSMAPIRLAASLTSGKTASEKVKAVYNWVVSRIDYDHGKNPPAGYVPSIVDTYNSREGICYDFAALFAAMLRSQGVPTKLVKGYADKVSGYHAWNEVYIGGKWYTVDTSYDAQVHGSMYKTSGYHKTSES